MTKTQKDDRAAWAARAEALRPQGQALIGGRFVEAASGRSFAALSPIDGRVLTQVAAGDAEDADRAVKSARAAFESGVWAKRPPRARKRTLIRFAELIRAHREELALLETLDMGKPIAMSLAVDVRAAADAIQWSAEAIDKLYDEIAPTEPNVLALIRREPLGVVAAVTPWNFPMIMAAWKIGPALALGNSVILKPAEQSSLTAIRLGGLALEAGIPEGVFNVLPGFGHEAGKALGLHMDVDGAFFTGSTEVGRMFARYSADSNLKKIGLELGGKSPFVVLASSRHLDAAAQSVVDGIFFNQGEMCTASSRLIAEDSIREELMEKVLEKARAYKPGDPLDPETNLGTLVDAAHTRRVLDYIASGEAEGARLALGGGRPAGLSGECYVEPTIFDQARPEMKIAREEIFGPVLTVLAAKDPEEALRLANDSSYGLGAAVWSDDLTTAHRFAAGLRAGVVSVNAYDEDDMTTPFGGYKQSGWGRDKSLHAFEKYAELKTIWMRLR